MESDKSPYVLADGIETRLANPETPIGTPGSVSEEGSVQAVQARLTCNAATVERAFRIALGDIHGNIAMFQDGLLEVPTPVLLAGLDYDTPWTRDAAINVWNAAGLLCPQIARNTLLSVLERTDGKIRIGGQYWDAIIWCIGAWSHYLYTGDREFLVLALEAVRNSLEHFEATEFDEQWNLFRGPACYGDGVAAYPNVWAQTNGSSFILDWLKCNPALVSARGYGLPMHALSTNCLYYQAYVLAGRMAGELGCSGDSGWAGKAAAISQAIDRQFWMPHHGRYRYLVDDFGGCEYTEGMGHSFALLFGLADSVKTQAVLKNQHVTAAGIPCVWPSFSRYQVNGSNDFGRHSGTVWPHIQAFWAEAAARGGRADLFAHEFSALTQHINRDAQCTEIYHPVSGEPYGGLQEHEGRPLHLWDSCARQTWSATGYLRMILTGLLGMRFETDGIRFEPMLPPGISHVRLENMPYRGMRLNVLAQRSQSPWQLTVDGRSAEFLPAEGEGERDIVLH